MQDIVSLQGGGEERYEVLLRYRGEDGKLVPPGAFLPPAERFGLSPKLDRWVIEEACRHLAGNPDSAARLSINLSGLSIADDELLPFVRLTLERYAVPASRLCFEITETAAITNLDNATRFIRDMKAVGCCFALDDFGSGLSSFGYLKNLPVDVLKIDGIFVRDIVSDELDRAMVRSINDIGQLLGKKTIAEFVENDEIAAILRNLGVDYGQGYGIARPRPIEEVLPEVATGDGRQVAVGLRPAASDQPASLLRLARNA
ncbi:EAL domain-containing protein [Marinobacterium aestuariivivens]|uniref:EAL domain-containing protein n=1 Tax=Marinobacterium aestuariivivens TaxID=1698799 RepID=A0ABW2A1Y0_9GAMM